jgi:hypothetical protein
MWRQMVRYLSTLTLSLFLAASAGAVPLRVLMENTQATNNALFVSTQTGSVYVQTGGSMTVKGGGGLGVTYGVTASTMGIGGAPSGTRKFQVYFNANNNSPSYGDGAVRYLDSVNGVGFECGALYGGSQPSWCQSGNDGMGSKKPFVFQPDGSNVGIRTLSPATTAALEVAGPVSVGGSGNTQYSLQASSGASFGSDVHVTGTLEATKLKGDGSQLTGIGGGGTVTTQGSPAAGQIAVFQAGTIISSGTVAANAWAGVNYVLWSASGAAVAFSTGMTSFQVAAATVVYQGAAYATTNAAFVIPKSSFSMVSWNPTNGYRQWGLASLNPASISTYTKANLTDDIIVALSSSDATGNVGILQSAWRLPYPGAFASSLNGAASLGANLGTVQVASYFSCVATYFDSCYTGRLRVAPADPSGIRVHDAGSAGSGVTANYVYSFVVNNSGGSSANAIFTSVGTNLGTNFASVDGGVPTSFSGVSGVTIANLSIPTGYHIVTVYAASGGASPYVTDTGIDLPANVSIVRGGM